MAGYREFQTGEVLTASNVNQFLMEQAVMTFADDAERAAALSEVLREGLLTYNEDTARLEIYDGTDWVEPAPEPPAGIGPNVVQTVKTNVFSTSSTSFQSVSGLSVTITPSSDQSKILVIAYYSLGHSGNFNAAHSELRRGSTTIFVGNASSSRVRSTGTSARDNVAQTYRQDAFTPVFLDNPTTDSPVTYQLRVRTGVGGTAYVGRSGANENSGRSGMVPSSITLIEVAP